MGDEMASPEPGPVEGDLEAGAAIAGDRQGDGGGRRGVAASMSVIDDAEATLSDVEAALERLESGDYGTCEVCHAPIEPSILERSPVARRCIAHAS